MCYPIFVANRLIQFFVIIIMFWPGVASRQTTEDEEASAAWNDTRKKGSPQKTGPSPVAGARSKSPAWGADAGQPDTGVATTTDLQHPKREPDQRVNIRWAETSPQVQNVRTPSDFVILVRRDSHLRDECKGHAPAWDVQCFWNVRAYDCAYLQQKQQHWLYFCNLHTNAQSCWVTVLVLISYKLLLAEVLPRKTSLKMHARGRSILLQ